VKKKIIAALQIGSSTQGKKDTLDKILSYKESIKQSNCDLLVMPEALLGGYPKGADFGARIGYRKDKGREDFLQYWQQAVDIEGPEIQSLIKLSIDCNTSMVIGIIERSSATLYCTALLISEKGELFKHRKLMPTASERLIWGQGDGSTIPVIKTAAGRIGAVICWENYMPLLRTAMYAKSIEIWCAPTVDDRDIWQTSMQHIAYEGRNFLVSSCQYQAPPTEGAFDETWPKEKPLIRGGSCIISPMGEFLAGPLYGKEGLIYAEIDLNDIIKARFDMDPTGHYSRPDVFKLIVNEQERPSLTRLKSEDIKDF
jgi:nitrilase